MSHPSDPNSPKGGIGDWGQEDPNAIGVHRGQLGSGPEVLVSSRDGAPVPHVAGAASLARTAERAGWTVRLTYACARVPAVLYVGTARAGLVRYPEHLLHTVAVRLARGRETAAALWAHEDDGPWRFTSAAYRNPVEFGFPRLVGVRELTERVRQA